MAAAVAIESNPILEAEDIVVSAVNGLVTLNGSVGWNFQRAEAERALMSLWQVTGLVNLITVRARPVLAQLRNEIHKDHHRRDAPEDIGTCTSPARPSLRFA